MLLPAIRPPLRLLLLSILLLLAIGMNTLLIVFYRPIDTNVASFIWLWIGCFVPYGIACALVLSTKAQGGRWQWLELGVILSGALILRAMLVWLPPNLSHDSWRYVWDARITLHGYSPYVTGPGDPLYVHLRDFIYDNSRFRNVPTIYPPAAQAIYLLSYLIAPSNLYVIKGIFVVFDLITCVVLILLLKRKGLDPARVVLYAWWPLPIVEFAIQGHLDAITVIFTILTLLCATGKGRSMRVLTGFLLALATLTKIYPILLLVVVVRRRDWALLITCFGTIILAYVPYLILGHGQVFGFFATYASEHTPNEGIVPLGIEWLRMQFGGNAHIALLIQYAIDLLLVGAVSLLVLIWRQRERISMEAATLLLFGTVFAISSHVFPWYTTVLVPWVALLLGPLWTQRKGWNATTIAALTAWYFACVPIIGYFPDRSWTLYYYVVYYATLLGLAAAAVAYMRQKGKRASDV